MFRMNGLDKLLQMSPENHTRFKKLFDCTFTF